MLLSEVRFCYRQRWWLFFFFFFFFSDLQFVRRPLLLMSMSFVYPFLVKLKINPARFEPHSSF